MGDSKSRYKVWKAVPETEAGFMVTPDSVVMAGSEQCFIVVDSSGVKISGPVSFVGTGDQIQQCGFFTQMPDFVQMIPSNMITVNPGKVPNPPKTIAKAIAMIPQLVPTMSALT